MGSNILTGENHAKESHWKHQTQYSSGQRNTFAPVGPALGQAGINMMEFLKKFNEMTAPQMGFVLPVEITVYEDRSYAFVVKQPLATDLIKRAAGITTGAANPKMDKAGVLTKDKLRDVAKTKNG